jgi:hypothetical protein
VQRPGERTRRRRIGFGGRGAGGAYKIIRSEALRKAKIKELDAARTVDDDVRRLEVAMKDSPGVRMGQGVSDLSAILEDQLGGQTVVRNERAQRMAGDVLHGDESLTAGVAYFEDGTDVRMVQRRGGARFAEQALVGPGIARIPSAKDFDGDIAAQSLIACAKDHTHAASTNLLKNGIVGELLAEHRKPWLVSEY